MEPEAAGSWTEKWSSKHSKPYWFNSLTGESIWNRPDISNLRKRNFPDNQWQKKWSAKQSRHFWWDSVSGKSVWEDPYGKDSVKGDDTEESTSKRVKINDDKHIISSTTHIAVIVPFRDLHEEQQRSKHLSIFETKMSELLSSTGWTFRLYIVEQNNDMRKFNRGKLLNIGFDIASRDGCAVFIFHDVDLLPSPDLLPFYVNVPTHNPVHIARVWNRYNKNKKYFGGIVGFSQEQFRHINGYPNNFWGWGGEDDELYNRIVEADFKPLSPTSGEITDLEDMTLDEKLKFLREHKSWKCMNKTETLAEHENTWKENGLRNLRYKVLSRRDAGVITRIEVDVGLNGHWTDLVCGVDDSQLDVNAEELKRRFKEAGLLER